MSRNVRRGSPSGPKATEKYTVAHAMGNAGTATVTAVTMTVTGLVTTDAVIVNTTAAPAAGVGLAGAAILAANVLTVYLVNPTAAQVAAGTMTFTITKVAFNS